MENLFGREQPDDWLPGLRRQAQSFGQDPLNIDLAVEFAVAAWSMVDLVRNHRGLDNSFPEQVKSTCPAMSYMRDVANIRRHGKIDRYTPVLRASQVHKGGFSREFSRGFDISGLELVLQDGTVVWFEDSVVEVVRFWERYFESA